MKLYVIGKNGEVKGAGQKGGMWVSHRHEKKVVSSTLRDEIMMLAHLESHLSVDQPYEDSEESDILSERCA